MLTLALSVSHATAKPAYHVTDHVVTDHVTDHVTNRLLLCVQERYRQDCNLAVQLLKCNKSHFRNHKFADVSTVFMSTYVWSSTWLFEVHSG